MGPLKEAIDNCVDRCAAVEDRPDGLADRHLDPQPLRQSRDSDGGRHTLDHRSTCGKCFAEKLTASESKPDSVIARLVGATGKHQVAEPGKPPKCLGAGTFS